MDTAFVPLNAMTHPSAWHVQPGVLPAGEGYDLGTVVSMSLVSGHGWVAYTERDDITGSGLERLNAWHVTGPWHVATQRWQARPAPGCGWTYSAQAHPASPAPPGQMLVSWASSHDDPGAACDMQPQFTDLPIGSPSPCTDGPGRGLCTTCQGQPATLPRATPSSNPPSAECSLTHNAPTRPEPENRHASADPDPESTERRFRDQVTHVREWPSHCVMVHAR
jgi:hypothetical protein